MDDDWYDDGEPAVTCSECGADVEDEDLEFCPDCGVDLSDSDW